MLRLLSLVFSISILVMVLGCSATGEPTGSMDAEREDPLETLQIQGYRA